MVCFGIHLFSYRKMTRDKLNTEQFGLYKNEFQLLNYFY